MLKRLFLFGAVNILVIATVTIILSLFGIQNPSSMLGLFAFCLIWGTVGSFISLMISKWMAKFMMGVQIVTEQGPHADLVQTVHRLARRGGLTTMPEVGIYASEELNAFATGPSRDNSLVAVSSGLLYKMDQDELEGVLAHEIAHIANGDMVTMALLQGVMNAFVMFFARIVAGIINQQMKGDDRDGEGLGPFAYMMVVMVLQMIFGIFASIIVNWFSRYREFRADYGGAKIGSKDKMIKALKALERAYPQMAENPDSNPNHKNFQSMQISSSNGMMALFSTHPTLRSRIKALEDLKI